MGRILIRLNHDAAPRVLEMQPFDGVANRTRIHLFAIDPDLVAAADRDQNGRVELLLCRERIGSIDVDPRLLDEGGGNDEKY